jgi:hypothetical protein
LWPIPDETGTGKGTLSGIVSERNAWRDEF